MLQLASLLRSRCRPTTYAANTRKIFNVISATSAKCFYYSSPGVREGWRGEGSRGGRGRHWGCRKHTKIHTDFLKCCFKNAQHVSDVIWCVYGVKRRQRLTGCDSQRDWSVSRRTCALPSFLVEVSLSLFLPPFHSSVSFNTALFTGVRCSTAQSALRIKYTHVCNRCMLTPPDVAEVISISCALAASLGHNA